MQGRVKWAGGRKLMFNQEPWLPALCPVPSGAGAGDVSKRRHMVHPPDDRPILGSVTVVPKDIYRSCSFLQLPELDLLTVYCCPIH